MSLEAPSLPSRFPCWVRAVYSWGGESKKDLGFVEGDLIECLNAGDGSWWMGRLRRDKRMVGLFPSNFVQVLDESFQPAQRVNSAVHDRAPSPSPFKNPLAAGPESKPFRKAFSAYAAPDIAAQKRQETIRTSRQSSPRQSSPGNMSANAAIRSNPAHRQHGSYNSRHNTPSPLPHQMQRPTSRNSFVEQQQQQQQQHHHHHHSRAPSPQPPAQYQQQYTRAPSPNPMAQYQQQQQQQPRALSPAPYAHEEPTYARAPSPHPHPEFHQYLPRPTTPAPPGGYVAYSPGRASPLPGNNYRPVSRGQSPAPQVYERPQQAYDRYRSHSPTPPQQSYYNSRAPSPNPYTRAVSPNPYTRAASPNPYARAVTPNPYDNYQSNSRAPSPCPYPQDDSPPPPPPPHRHVYTPQPPEPERGLTPCPPSPGPTGFTPSPLRNAMDDVMSSLDGMGNGRNGTPEVPLDPWAPEQFDETYSRASRRSQHLHNPTRPATADVDHYMASRSQYDGADDEPPVLSNYVQRMESRLKHRYPRNSDESLNGMRENSRTAPPHTKFGSVGSVPRPQSSMADRPFQDPPALMNSAMPAHPQQRPKSSMGQGRDREEGMGRDSISQRRPKHQKSQSDMGPDGQGAEVVLDKYGRPKLRHRKSAFEVGKEMIGRTFTTKSTSTNASSTVQSVATGYSSNTTMTDRSIMSGQSAGAFSSTSAGSLNRKKEKLAQRAKSAMGMRDNEFDLIKGRFEADSRPTTPMTGVTYHTSHASANENRPRANSSMAHPSSTGNQTGMGGLQTPKAKKSGFFKKIFESAKTGAASSRKTFTTGDDNRPRSSKGFKPDGITAIAGGMNNIHSVDSGRESALQGGGSTDWLEVRRDVNRANSLSQIEILERKERCQMLDYPAISPVEELYEMTAGDEDAQGMAVPEPTNFSTSNLGLVDKGTRFIKDLPSGTSAATLSTNFVCRPYRSEVQRLRAIFTWVSENIQWEEEYVMTSPADSTKVIRARRGCAEEVAVLVMEMCRAVNIHCMVVRGFLKTPGESPLELLGPPSQHNEENIPRSNHWWNAILVDGQEWRILDCSLASPSNPNRALYSSNAVKPSDAEFFWFLTRPIEAAWSHIPENWRHQHLAPAVPHSVLLSLPCGLPPFFRNGLILEGFNTGLLRLEDLEVGHVKITTPPDVELVAEVECKSFHRDQDGDLYESGEIIKKRALCQAEWVGGRKRYTVKAVLPSENDPAPVSTSATGAIISVDGDGRSPTHPGKEVVPASQGVLKIYAGKRGLMHSIKDIPHPLALTLFIEHTESDRQEGFGGDGKGVPGGTPGFEFVRRHPTPHASRHDLYIAQPQCGRLVCNNTYVFAIRQHPSSLTVLPTDKEGRPEDAGVGMVGGAGIGAQRPGSAMSMTNSVVSGYSDQSKGGAIGSNGPNALGYSSRKPAKLAIQSPSGKILRLMRKEERGGVAGMGRDGESMDGGCWETIIKVGERGVWRGLVLADRTARWCVMGEWVCV